LIVANDGLNPPGAESGDIASPLNSELQLVRILDRTLKSRYPDGVSLIKTLEGGLIIELHKQIRQAFNPHACANATELTEYLWLVGRPPSLEPGGGLTIRGKLVGASSGGGSGGEEKFVIGRKFFKDAEIEYKMLHGMIAEALGKGG
jgi:hypothetical protein